MKKKMKSPVRRNLTEKLGENVLTKFSHMRPRSEHAPTKRKNQICVNSSTGFLASGRKNERTQRGRRKCVGVQELAAITVP